MRATIASKVDDERVLSLVDVILASGADAAADVWEPVLFPGDDLLSVLRPRGLPIGNLTSQFWANVFLNPFDHFVTRELRCSAYVRYVDDMLLFHSEKATLFEWRAAMFRRLEAFRLTFHAHAQPRLVADGIPFLGFIVLPERRRLKRRKGLHFRRKLVEMLVEHRQGSRATADVSVRVRGWINHVRYANTIGLRRAVFRDAARLTAARLRALSSRTSAGR
ncbi:MAG: RNA-directed DNA polymerase [Vicinamibacterales bacterium]